MPDIRALSIQQPWIDAIVCGPKAVENRTWRPSRDIYGQDIALHASQRFDKHAVFPPQSACQWMTMPECRNFTGRLGAVLAVATVRTWHHADDCRHELSGRYCSQWAMPDQYHWELDHVCPLAEPVPCKGALGLWRLPEDVEAAVREQTGVRRG